MQLASLFDRMESLDLGHRGDPILPPRDNVRAVQALLRTGLEDADFFADCVELAMSRAAREEDPPSVRRLGERGIALRFIYWSPGDDAGPHEHSSWTVTSVLHNALTVTTYEMEAAYQRRVLEPKSVFDAAAGAVGHIYEHCIHNPENRTRRVSASLHLFNSNDQPKIEREAGPIPGLGLRRRERETDRERQDPYVWGERLARLHARMLGQRPSARSLALLERLFSAGDGLTRCLVACAIHGIDETLGARRFVDALDLARTYRLQVERGAGPLSVRARGGALELVRRTGDRDVVLVRTDASAQRLFELVVRSESDLMLGELESELDAIDLVRLACVLVEVGVLSPIVHGPSASMCSFGRGLTAHYQLPEGPGPFPVLVWNHGSEREPLFPSELASFFVHHGYAVFVPHRRGHGMSAGRYVMERRVSPDAEQGDAALVDELENQVDDVADALSHVRAQPWADRDRIVVAGSSFGGILTVLLAAHDDRFCAGIDFAGGAWTWDNHRLRERLRTAALNARAPLFFIQAENDISTEPTRMLGQVARERGLPHRAQIYPATEGDAMDGHLFFSKCELWGQDVLRFLDDVALTRDET